VILFKHQWKFILTRSLPKVVKVLFLDLFNTDMQISQNPLLPTTNLWIWQTEQWNRK